jgi:hypothetical protein
MAQGEVAENNSFVATRTPILTGMIYPASAFPNNSRMNQGPPDVLGLLSPRFVFRSHGGNLDDEALFVAGFSVGMHACRGRLLWRRARAD